MPEPVEQPISFSHKTHAGAKMTCDTCHPGGGKGVTMGIPQSASCMVCHKTVKSDSPAIRKLAALAKKRRPVDWVRVYQIPDFVKFSHRDHLASGNDCEACHGPVASRDQLAREHDISQNGCLACHTPRNVTFSCTFCHF